MKICIIGAGVTGLILLLMLTQAGINPQDIVIIDPYFDGGDLCGKWGPVQSNTHWGKTITTLREVLGISIPDSFDLEATTPLSAIGDLLIGLAAPLPVKRIMGFVTRVESKAQAWTVEYHAGASHRFVAQTIILAQGSDPKIGSLPIPSIPLECALDPARISEYLTPDDHVILFGTMHSGTLVMKNLNDLEIKTTAVYKGQPFVWDRDGAYDGIKQEAAAIADEVQAGTYKHLTLMPFNTEAISRVKATWAVYAMGFTPRVIEVVVEGKHVEGYDGHTGQIAPGAWGFGIAYPNSAPDGIHWDVSVAAFALHIQKQISSILAQHVR